jgi:hypothetical protein
MCQEDGNCVSATFIEPLWQVKSINKNEMHPLMILDGETRLSISELFGGYLIRTIAILLSALSPR